MNIDFASLLAGVSITAIGGWFASFLALRKEERAVHLEQITKERTKWRQDMRLLTQEVVELFSNDTVPVNDKKQKFRAKLATSINPNCDYDKHLLALFDQLSHKGSMDEFTNAMSFLLKHDWERVKWECMPIYLKPFKRYTQNQKEWRATDFRPRSNMQEQG
ncbi:hypothetical protein OPW36_13025 [Vibrio europaeus]|uniref:Uncharacterized protein n=1 Tax=Vibrio europaeus TaxID=300876 RepID=A0AAE7DYS9_9VIBR|nr:hypothetical protein [Vibrio europaeus]MDC5806204.1 hypothetical protein [Vibrio europaeus]MDC5812518.1 hypothetical protein [Vibrio europaeus]MDC5825633.1 hypothetical protein [Vibrio europaeus]MDC5831087.1 hypothetical protein [Vibrio europaeus]MDC5834043.1 hypothetical protein [Vibrio europaeus]